MAVILRPNEVPHVYKRMLTGTSVHGRFVDVGAGERVHVLETGDGPRLVLLHGSGSPGLFLLPLLEQLTEVRAVAPDRPGRGLSDAANVPRAEFRDAAVAWVDRLLDALKLDSTALLGHSAGGLWALWYALAHSDRVQRLVLLGPPALPGTRCPLPYRIMATPGIGQVVRRLAPPSRTSTLQFARFMGERETIVNHPDLIDLLVAAGRDPVAAQHDLDEVRAIVSPLALASPSGFRRRLRVQPAELRQLTTPTLLVWGEHEPLAGVARARAVTELIPDARLEVLAAGHAPWLGHPGRTAALITSFVLTDLRTQMNSEGDLP